MKNSIKQGVTLIEIMLAVSIMAMAVIPIFGMLTYSNRGTREQDAEGIAANLAKEEMNRLMNVVTRTNLLSGSGSPQAWSLGMHDIKGNIFSGEYTVFATSNSNLNFSIPQMTFHDPRLCPTGKETKSGVLASPIPVKISDVLPDLPGDMIADIMLRVKWRMPYESSFDPKKEFILVARRSFLVKN